MHDHTNDVRAARTVQEVITVPSHAPGFGGEAHLAALVVSPDRFAVQDPFLILADDLIDLAPGKNLGGAHPHAGF